METTRLGRTELTVTRTAFGALPIQRIDMDEAKAVLRKAYESGINFFDTARAYTDSEEKIGHALADVRGEIILATKTHGQDKRTVLEHIETSLRKLRTDCVDILQLHNPRTLPDPNDPDSSYSGLLEARRKGMVRFIGVTNHRIDLAKEAVDSGLYDTMQFPLSAISADKDLDLIGQCQEADVGLIAMKALCGGLLNNARVAFTFLRQYPNVVPIWGIQRMSELDEFLALDADPPAMDEAMSAAVERERRELAGDFCRACGYCLPCPQDIPIPMAARMGLLLRRAPSASFLTPEWQEKMRRIENCIDCGQCRERCPYGLDTPALLRKMLVDYEAFLAGTAS